MKRPRSGQNVICLGELIVSSKTESMTKLKRIADELMKKHKKLIKEVHQKKEEKREKMAPDMEGGDYVG